MTERMNLVAQAAVSVKALGHQGATSARVRAGGRSRTSGVVAVDTEFYWFAPQ
jgi:MFS superfamily sulfate permease-like transporter